ncbi:MAG: hypothetical protein KC505_06730 [Myxococcales bacterium]|nr:hypothetical protein [Myxococcales bacterium]USN50265.1 MAG: hypothetical protein H6731_08330 [Myxococcales bacterium]
MMRKLLLMAIALASCSLYSNSLQIDSFEVFITHPRDNSEFGSLRYMSPKGRILLEFPFKDDLLVSKVVNQAREENKYLDFVTQDSYYSEQPPSLQMSVGLSMRDPQYMEFESDQVSLKFQTVKKILAVSSASSYIEYQINGRTKRVNLYFESVEDCLAKMIEKSKNESRKIYLNIEWLKHKKRQQYLPLNFFAYSN